MVALLASAGDKIAAGIIAVTAILGGFTNSAARISEVLVPSANAPSAPIAASVATVLTTTGVTAPANSGSPP